LHFERGRWLIEFREDYSQFFQPCNWYTFRFVQFEIENDAAMGGLEATAAILGLSVRVSYTYDRDTEMRRELLERVSQIDQQ
jgi:hypothetical protein